MNVKERFEQIRSAPNDRINLRSRLTLLVTLELLVCVPIAYGIDAFLKHVVVLPFDIPLFAELLFVCLLVGLLITGLLTKIFFEPVKKLRKAMEQVADGNFDVRLDEKASTKEIREINAGFNLMVHELQATEILQTDFVSNVSHEFKTPINAIEGYSTLLHGSDNLDAEQRKYVDKILFNTQRLSSLVGSILLLSKLENQQISTNRSNYRLDEQIRQSIVAQEPVWEKKDIEFDVELARLEYTGSEVMMRHVWDNLISNAVKFSPNGGLVRILLTKTESGLVFIIEDQGPGLSEEAQKHAFDKFYQADNSHKQEGNGLGLALVKRILSMENGAIHVENRLEGGCRFIVSLHV